MFVFGFCFAPLAYLPRFWNTQSTIQMESRCLWASFLNLLCKKEGLFVVKYGQDHTFSMMLMLSCEKEV